MVFLSILATRHSPAATARSAFLALHAACHPANLS
jgi:hypothetical protein